MKGSHNSGTGERSFKWWHKLLVPFARCQSKSLKEQWKAGVRYFDLRYAWVDGKWRLAHGLWTGRMTLDESLKVLVECSEGSQQHCHVSITQERGFFDEFCFTAKAAVNRANAVSAGTAVLEEVAIKNPGWKVLYKNSKRKLVQNFYVIKGWKVLIPIPWFWDKVWKVLAKKRGKCTETGYNSGLKSRELNEEEVTSVVELFDFV